VIVGERLDSTQDWGRYNMIRRGSKIETCRRQESEGKFSIVPRLFQAWTAKCVGTINQTGDKNPIIHDRVNGG